jgi:hypothetical protein
MCICSENPDQTIARVVKANDWDFFSCHQWFLHSWTSSKMSQFFPLWKLKCRETFKKKLRKKYIETDQHLNPFEKNPRLKVPAAAKFVEVFPVLMWNGYFT